MNPRGSDPAPFFVSVRELTKNGNVQKVPAKLLVFFNIIRFFVNGWGADWGNFEKNVGVRRAFGVFLSKKEFVRVHTKYSNNGVFL